MTVREIARPRRRGALVLALLAFVLFAVAAMLAGGLISGASPPGWMVPGGLAAVAGALVALLL